MRVLHVSNRWGGGVKTVVQQYARNVPEAQHLLLRGPDPWQVPGEDDLFESITDLPPRLAAASAVLRRLVRTHSVDVVHAHSSFAGVLTRLLPAGPRLVYTPHAFAFLAAPGSRVWVAGQAERVLGLRRVTVAATSDAEASAASAVSPRSDVVRICNLADQSLGPDSAYSPALRVVMSGRICPQKDPDFFAATARAVRSVDPSIRFEWLGDGDPDQRQRLEDAGVHVRGWLPLARLHEHMRSANVYLHSAAYEGACLSLLDAAACGLPTIGRPVPGVGETPWITLAKTPTAAASAVLDLRSWSCWNRTRARVVDGVAELTPSLQRRQLLAAYGVEVSCTPSTALHG